MSLLYECINGIIQGGILDGAEDDQEGNEIASLCVGKLRGMIMVEGDPNCKVPQSRGGITSMLKRLSSKIRCSSGFQQDCRHALAPSLYASGCYHELY